jgi:uncharacterized membrane protein YhaH (DUF805 family)
MTNIRARKLFHTEGRIDRTTFIAHLSVYSAAFFAVYLVIYFIDDFVPKVATNTAGMLVLSIVLILCVPLLIRRAHDFDESSWFVLMIFVPFVNLMFFISPGSPIPNRFGDVPPNSYVLTKVLALLYLVWPFIVFWIILWPDGI